MTQRNYVINDMLVSPGNVQLLAQAMLDLISNDSLKQKYKQNGLKKAQSFELEVMVNRYIELFDNSMGFPKDANTSS